MQGMQKPFAGKSVSIDTWWSIAVPLQEMRIPGDGQI